MTIPPFAIVSVPVPKLPILSPPPGLLFQVEPGPVTVTVPVEPTANPTEPPPELFTVPPFWMVSVPVPEPPTTTFEMFVHVEPAPDTVTVPREPGKLPTNPPKSVNVPPFWTTSVPIPFWPTPRFRAVAPALVTAVEFGVTVSMFALVAAVGTPAFQLPAVNQSEETAPVQLVWARVETVDAAKTAIVASNMDKTNLQPARTRDVAPRRGPMDDSGRGLHPISASNQSGNAKPCRANIPAVFQSVAAPATLR